MVQFAFAASALQHEFQDMTRNAEYDGSGKKWAGGAWEEIAPRFRVTIKRDGSVVRHGQAGPRILVKRKGKILKAKKFFVPNHRSSLYRTIEEWQK